MIVCRWSGFAIASMRRSSSRTGGGTRTRFRIRAWRTSRRSSSNSSFHSHAVSSKLAARELAQPGPQERPHVAYPTSRQHCDTRNSWRRCTGRSVGLLSSFDGWHGSLDPRGTSHLCPLLFPSATHKLPQFAEVPQKCFA